MKQIELRNKTNVVLSNIKSFTVLLFPVYWENIVLADFTTTSESEKTAQQFVTVNVNIELRAHYVNSCALYVHVLFCNEV